MRKANMNTVSWSKCNASISKYTRNISYWASFREGLSPCHYCAADPRGMSNTCEGDSGGPLQIVHPNSNMSTVVGVVSTGYSCSNSVLGIYTRVAYFIDWIESYVWPNGEIVEPQMMGAE